MNETYQNKISYTENIEQQLESKNAEFADLRNKMLET